MLLIDHPHRSVQGSVARLLSALALALAVWGCPADGSDVCTTEYVYGLDVTVEHGASDGRCDVTVTATDGEYVEELMCAADGPSCSCHGAGERAGTYLVEVMSEDDVLVSQQAGVSGGTCHVVPETVVIALP